MRVPGTVWFLAAVLVAPPLAAQTADPPFDTAAPDLVSLSESELPPAYVAALEGSATLVRGGESTPVDLNLPIIEGDRLRVDSGFVALRWDDGTGLFLEGRATLDVVAPGRLRLADGRARYVAGRPDGSARWAIDTPAGTVALDRAQDVFVDVDGTSANQPVEAFAIVGDLEMSNDRGSYTARQGESVHAEAFRSPIVGRARVTSTGLMAWSQRELEQGRGTSLAAPVSNGIVEYDDYAYDASLVRYGTWERDPEYGSIWYPSVAVDWRPYYNGRWERLGRYGYVWIGTDPWSYRTHHYGRWGYRANRWFWIPGRTWASAWVSWAVGPGYVSWSPLGYDDRPVFSFSISYGSGYRHGYYRDPYDGWFGWTVVPSDRWRRGGRVDRFAVNPRQLPEHVRGGFVTQSRAPYRTGGTVSRMGRDNYAVPRGDYSRGRADSNDSYRRGAGPARVESGSSRGYLRTAPQRQPDSSTSPYERARRYQDRGTGPRGDRGSESAAPGAIRRGGSENATRPAERPPFGSRTPSYRAAPETSGSAPVERAVPRYRDDNSGGDRENRWQSYRATRPGDSSSTERAPAAERATPRYRSDDGMSSPRNYDRGSRGSDAPRYRPDDAASSPRTYDRGSRSGNDTPRYRPEASAPRNDDGGGRARQRESTGGSSGRMAAPRSGGDGGGERSRPSRGRPRG